MQGDTKKWKGGMVLAALPMNGECMTLDTLEAQSGIPRDRITRLITPLNRHGLVSMARLACYHRTPAGDAALVSGRGLGPGPKGPHGILRGGDGINLLIWRGLRRLKKATIPELLELADSTLKDPEDMAQRYLRRLRKAGIVSTCRKRVRGTALTSNGFAQHVLIKDLGPLCPIWRSRENRLFDQNAGAYLDAVNHD